MNNIKYFRRVAVNIILQISCCLLVCLTFSSCKKQDEFLDKKPNSRLFTISTLNDCQNLIQTESIFNGGRSPYIGLSSTDDYFMLDENFQTLDPVDQQIYIWNKDINWASTFPGGNDPNWSRPYEQVYYANTVLDALEGIEITAAETNRANQIRGSALFYRSFAHFNLLQLFAVPYDSVTASTDLGIPLRLTSDLNTPSHRSSQTESYNQIIADLQTAIQLLPAKSTFVTLPSQNAANALLARLFMVMGKYEDAMTNANSALDINNKLFDFNTAAPGAAFYLWLSSSEYPISENIYHSVFAGNSLIGSIGRAIVDSSLYNSYDTNDLRKQLWFMDYQGQKRFIGSYEFYKTPLYHYDGLANDEMYLIRAECSARLGDVSGAMNDLNALLRNRYKSGTFVDRTAIDEEDALRQILAERRKELCFRGLRWTDLRRLNKDSRFAVTLTRVVEGTTYTLPPNDPKYTFQIPDNEIQLSGIQQNNR